MDYPRFIARSFADKLLPEEVLNLAIRIEAFGDIRARAVEEKMLAYGEACRRAGAEAAPDADKIAREFVRDWVDPSRRSEAAPLLANIIAMSAEAASPAAGWRDIASAPEGVPLLFYYPQIEHLGPVVKVGFVDRYKKRQPTHWMPTPSAPSEEARAG